MAEIVPCTDEFEEYLRDESRSVGSAESIVFPESEADARDALHALPHRCASRAGRTFRLGGWRGSPCGCVLNTSRMNRVLRMRRGSDGRSLCCVQPAFAHGAARPCCRRRVSTRRAGTMKASPRWLSLKPHPRSFSLPDPTEASAALGGIVACNASGSRSYAYGAAAPPR